MSGGADSPFVVLGNPANRRVQLFAEAFARRGKGRLEVVAWLDFLRDPAALQARLTPESVLRIESSGEDFAVEQALLRRGLGTQLRVLETTYALLRSDALDRLSFEPGRVLPMRQWYRGWEDALTQVRTVLDAVPGARVLNPPEDIAVMFDKAACHERFATLGIPVPCYLGEPFDYHDLLRMMDRQRCLRAFIKPCHGSSASGVVALEINQGTWQQQAFTSLEMIGRDGKNELYNSLRVQRLRDSLQIRKLIERVCHERCIAEAWFPKAGLDGRRFDLRVLVIAGRSAHAVVRQSEGPMTNLHLGNVRGDPARLRERLGEGNWLAAQRVCEQAAAAFPNSHYVAVDLLIAPDFRRFAVAEVNAFGDLLPRVEHHGMDTYAAELAAWDARHA